MSRALAVQFLPRPGRPMSALTLRGLGLFFFVLYPAAADGAVSAFTKPQHRQPWLTLYGPLRLGVDPDDDNHTLSALGTWLRLDCPADEGNLLPLTIPRPARDDSSASSEDVLHDAEHPSPAAAPWPRPAPTSLATPPDIIFFTDDRGETCDLLQNALGLDHDATTRWEDMRARVRCLNECVHPQHQRLDVACITDHASKTARTPVMSLVNSDIALGPDFVRAMQGLFFFSRRDMPPSEGSQEGTSGISTAGDNLLVIGRRTDLNLPTPRIDFDDQGWAATLHGRATQQGRLHSEYGIDYLATARPGIWARPPAKPEGVPPGAGDDDNDDDAQQARPPRQLFLDETRACIEMPPFIVGVYRWDSFAVARAILSPAIAVIDTTAAVMAVHLQRATADEPPQHRFRRGATYGDRLVHKSIGKRYLIGRTSNADYELTAGGDLLARVDSLAM